MKKDIFDYTWGNDLVKFNSLSPNLRFYYKIQEPVDKYWGLFVAKIAFFDINCRLIYHNQQVFADPLQGIQDASIRYAFFSTDGNLVYFRERGEDIKQLNHVLIDLPNEKYKIVPWSELEDSSEIEEIEKGLFSSEALTKFENVEWRMTKKDKLQMKTLLGINKWYPILR